MLALNEQHAKEYEKSMLGSELKVLLEEVVEINGEQWYIGHSMEYIKTAVKKQDNIHRRLELRCIMWRSLLRQYNYYTHVPPIDC